MTLHERTHTGVKTDPCKEGDTTFHDGGDLEKHATTHTGEKPSTSQPHSEISTSINLTPSDLEKHARMHERTHTGEKPFVCPESDKTFTQKASLKIQYLTHAEEKPYAYPRHDKKFNQNSSLHEGSHAGAKPYPCNEYNTAFNNNGDLEKHAIIHTGEKPLTSQHHHTPRAAMCAPCQQEEGAIQQDERAGCLKTKNTSAQKDADDLEKSQECPQGKLLRALLQVKAGTRAVLGKARELLEKVPYGQH